MESLLSGDERLPSSSRILERSLGSLDALGGSTGSYSRSYLGVYAEAPATRVSLFSSRSSGRSAIVLSSSRRGGRWLVLFIVGGGLFVIADYGDRDRSR